MEELDIAAVVHRSIRGVFALVTRTLFIQIINFFVNIFLTFFLLPSTYGVYGVVLAVIAFLQYFSDIGLAGALIQKREALTQEDLKTTFTIQQGLVITSSVIALLLSSVVARFYHLPSSGILLFQVLVISFFISSLKTIPSILLERNLRFEKLVIPQIVETVIFDFVVLTLAVRGFGVASFTYAVLARGIGGLIAIYIISPWKMEIGFSKSVAKKLLSFGIPFQANSFLALIKDDLLIAYIGKVLPLTQVGYIIFAQKWALSPLRLIMDNVIRITFPSFSRLQHDAYHLGKAVEKSIFVSTLFIFPSLVGLTMLAPSLMVLFPKYQAKWEPALLSLGFFAVNAGLSAISSPLTNVLQAMGKVKIALYLMIFWTILTWVLTPLFLYLYGFNGFAGASAVISLSVVLVVFLAKKYISFSVKPLIVPIVASIVLAGFIFVGNQIFPKDLVHILFLILGGTIIYFFVCFILARDELVKDLVLIRKQFIQS